ncbi:MAG: alpha/beta hydrolase-fold protein [Treponema sp.]|nr:alpha/beta hydrolase-fold protein [Treponema sp.]
MKRTAVVLCCIFTAVYVPAKEIKMADISKAPVYTDAPEGFDQMHSGIKYGEITEDTYFSKTTGTDRKCNVLLPAGYDSSRKYPVIYLLHGIGGDHKEWLQGNPVYIAGNAVAAGGVPCVIVMPNVRAMNPDRCPSDPFSAEAVAGFDNFIHDLFTDLMPFIENNYAVQTGRDNTAVAGLSMGGRESLYIGFTKQESFCAVGAFSPAPGLLPVSGFDGMFKPDSFKFKDGMQKPDFVLICTGDHDSMVGTVATTYHETLIKNGVGHFWYVMPGDHNFTVWKNGLYNFCIRVFR